jgi:predicted nucleic acid-binding protein
MMTLPTAALFDTSVVLDYLRGVKPADLAFSRFDERAITVISWVEVMQAAPLSHHSATREFLLQFERLSVNEAIADHALELMQRYETLELKHALPWAVARVNQMVYVTSDFTLPDLRDEQLWVAYGAGS